MRGALSAGAESVHASCFRVAQPPPSPAAHAQRRRGVRVCFLLPTVSRIAGYRILRLEAGLVLQQPALAIARIRAALADS